MVIKAIITTLDNLPLLKEQIELLKEDELVSDIIVVNNGSIDGTREFLDTVDDVIVINRQNLGAGPGRNAGLNAAGEFDYVLMLDGGIRPLRGGTRYMLEYLERHPDVDVVSPEVASCFTTDTDMAQRRMVEPIDDAKCFPQRMLSSTAYCLCRASAWDGIRFSEEGPFGEPGWGVDDNDMAFRWNEAGILHHDFPGVMCYRRASGSFARLHRETGVYPNQYGSVYEKRIVKIWQDYPHQWNYWNKFPLQISCVILGWNEYPTFVKAIKVIHDDLYAAQIPHEVIFVDNGSTDATREWLDTFALRQHWGDTAIKPDGGIIRKGQDPELEKMWTGNVIRVDLNKNMGTGYGYNIGFEKAKGRYIFYLSGDILPVPGSISGLYNYLENHDDADYVCVNAWVCQEETEDVKFDGFDGMARQGLGNYAYCYAMFRREIWDEGCKMADTGPFAGSGCGYEEQEFAYLMGEKGYKCWMFNGPTYYHHRRDFERSGHEEVEKQDKLMERRMWINTRWKDANFAIIHYHEQPKVHQRRKVAVVYKYINERPGPGGLTMLGLKDICDVGLFKPGQEKQGYDNYIYVDNGDFDFDAYAPPRREGAILWAIDMVTPQQSWRPNLDSYVEVGKRFGKVYAAQKDAAEYFIDHGVQAEWLPLAASKEYHKAYISTKKYSWAALWHNCGERISYALAASERFPDGFVGWVDGKDYALRMAEAKCVINLSRSNELNLRVFEAMMALVPLVTDRARGLDELFVEGEHYLGFDSIDEMLDKIDWVNTHAKEACEMAKRARSLVVKKHTYYHRALTMIGASQTEFIRLRL